MIVKLSSSEIKSNSENDFSNPIINGSIRSPINQPLYSDFMYLIIFNSEFDFQIAYNPHTTPTNTNPIIAAISFTYAIYYFSTSYPTDLKQP
ncbi:hypothetical protein [Confluentibacter sediminis]|uniref:hypothetical protein n=1 Tax=Confluentibacter sediminis TaxID=2219045 RepID=UPI0013A6AC75|nr:hypothetical protein [Confluentibacter sediminis]